MRLLSFDDISFDDILLDYNISDDDIFVNDILKRVYHLKLMCGRMMLGSKAPNYDAYGLRRVASLFRFRCYALSQSYPIFAYRGGSQGLSPTYEQAHVDSDLLTLAS